MSASPGPPILCLPPPAPHTLPKLSAGDYFCESSPGRTLSEEEASVPHPRGGCAALAEWADGALACG